MVKQIFIEKGDFPSEQEQIEEYTRISQVTYPNSVTIRTYDIGGDKLLPGSHKEDNPFLGWRGIRICLDRVEIFKEQLRASPCYYCAGKGLRHGTPSTQVESINECP